MAASEETCEENPDFAVICSFITKFGSDCGVNISIPYLKQALEDTVTVNEDLTEIYIHLLRRGRKRVTKEKWERSLIKFCHEYSSVDAWELERFGYLKSKLSIKLELLKRLLELQFDSNVKFKTEVNKQEAESLRVPPIGRDIEGHVYWYQLDKDYNMRLYRQSVEDENDWHLLCSSTEELRSLLDSLERKTGINKEKSSDQEIKEIVENDEKIKTETDEDLKACISQTKPCTVIIKTERKDVLLNASGAKDTESATNIKEADSVEEQTADIKDEDKSSKCDQNLVNIKVEGKDNCDHPPVDIKNKNCDEIADIKNKATNPNDKITPMETDSNKVLKNEIPIVSEKTPANDVEMTDAPTAKCNLELKDIDKEKPSKSPSKIDVDKKTAAPEQEKLKNKETTLETVTSPVKKETCKIDSNKHNFPAVQMLNEPNFKGGKMRLYERWNNEKRQAALSGSNELHTATDLSSNNQKSIVPEPVAEDLSFDSRKTLAPLSLPKTGTHQSLNTCPPSPVDEVPMDLSVSHRTISPVRQKVPETSYDRRIDYKKVSSLSKTSLESNVKEKITSPSLPSNYKRSESDFKNASEAPRPLKKKHISMIQDEHAANQSSENLRKSVIFEVKSSKHQTGNNDSIIVNKVNSESSFSHLQALQNMCDNDMRLNAQNSVIHSLKSENRLNSNSVSGKTNLDSCGKAYNDACCDNLSKMYNFNSAQSSDKTKMESESSVLSVLLKSNISHPDSSKKSTKSEISDLSKPITEIVNKMDIVEERNAKTGKLDISKVTNSFNEKNSISSEKYNGTSGKSEIRILEHKEKESNKSEALLVSKKPDSKPSPVSNEEHKQDSAETRENITNSEKDLMKNNQKDLATHCENVKKSNADTGQSKSDIKELTLPTDKKSEIGNTSINETLVPDNKRQIAEISDQKVLVVSKDVDNLESKQNKKQSIQTASITQLSLVTENKSKDLCQEQFKVSDENCKDSNKKDLPVSVSVKSKEEEVVKVCKKQDIKLIPLSNISDKFKKSDIKSKASPLELLQSSAAADSKEAQKACNKKISSDANCVKNVDKDLLKSSDKEIEKSLDENISSKKTTKIFENKESSKTSADDSISKSSEVKESLKTANQEFDNSDCKSETDNKEKTDIQSSTKVCSVDSNKKVPVKTNVEKKKSDLSSNLINNKEISSNKSSLKEIESTKDSVDSNNLKNNDEKLSSESVSSNQKGEKLDIDVCIKDKKDNISSTTVVTQKDEESHKDKAYSKLEEKDLKKSEELPKETNLSTETATKKSEKNKSEDLNKEEVTKNKIKEQDVSSNSKEIIHTSSKDKSNLDYRKNKKDTFKDLDDNKQITCEEEKTTQNVSSEKEKNSCQALKNKIGEANKCEINNTEQKQNKSKTKEDPSDIKSDEADVEDCDLKDKANKSIEKESSDIVEAISNDEKLKSNSEENVTSSKFTEKESASIKSAEKEDSSLANKDEIKKIDDAKTEKDSITVKNISEESCTKEGSEASTVEVDLPLKEKVDSAIKNNLDSESCLKELKDDKIDSKELDSNIEDSIKASDDLSALPSIKDSSEVNKQKKPKPRKKLFTPRKYRRKPRVKNTAQTSNEEDMKLGKESDKTTEEKMNIDEDSSESEVKTKKLTKNSLTCNNNNESKSKCEIPPKTHNLEIFALNHTTCLETKMKRVTFDELPVAPSPAKKQTEKPNLITTFSLDMTDDIEIIEEKVNVSPLKKKKGRLRTPSKVPEPKKSAPPKTPPKTTPKPGPKKRGSRNTQKSSLEGEKESFTIPEGFLEILSNAQSEPQSPQMKQTKSSRTRNKKETVTTSQQSSEGESTPIKRSRRIQEQHQKKISELAVEMEREQRLLEQLAKKTAKKVPTTPPPKPAAKVTEGRSRGSRTKLKPPISEEDTCMEAKRTTRRMNNRSRNMTKMTLMYEDESKSSEFSTSRETDKSKKRRRGRGSRKGTGYRPWDVSSESSSTLEELTEEEEEEHEEEPLIFEVNEDEFACEEIDENAEPVVVRRARTAKKTPAEDMAETIINDDTPCIKCGKYDRPEWILLCDKCDNGYHTSCLLPPLLIVPDGDWYCQPCQHIFLCEYLQSELNKLEIALKQRERDELRKQRLAYVGISLDNVLKPDKKEKVENSTNDEEEDEEDEEEVKVERKIRKARESSDDERHKKLFGKRSVRARRNVNYQFKEYDELIASAIQEEMIGSGLPLDEAFKEDPEKDEERSDSEKSFKASVRPSRKRKTRKLNDLNFTDEDDDDSGDEYQGLSSDSEHTPPQSSNESEAQSAASGEWRIVKTKGKRSKKRARRGRRGRDSSEEDWEGNESDSYRPATRRAAQKAISYRELSSDEEEEWNAPKAKLPKKRKKASSSEDSEASYKKKPAKRKSRVRKWASSESSESEGNISFKESDTSQEESENEWKIKKSYEGNRIKININKKVLSSEGESSSQEPAVKKRSNKIESEESEEDEEEEEEDDEEEEVEEEEDDDEEEDESSSGEEDEESEEEPVKPKPVEQIKAIQNKELTKTEVVKTPEIPKSIPKTPAVSSTDPVKVQVDPATPVVRDKPSVRTVKKDATKMVPCVIPYVKSPKSGQATTPDDESDKEVSKEKDPSVPKTKTAILKQNQTLPINPSVITQSKNKSGPESRSFASTIMEPFSNMDEESEDSVPLERIPTNMPPSIPNKPRGFDQEYTPAKELSSFSYTAPEEKGFPPTYSPLAPFADFSSRPSPLKPSLVETYSNNSNPSKLTPLDNPGKLTPLDNPSKLMPLDNPSTPSKFSQLDSYSRSNSPRVFASLDYSETRKKKHFFGGAAMDAETRPVHAPSENYQGEIRFPPEPYPCPQSPNTYTQRSSPHVQRDPGTPPRLYSQYPDAYAPPRSPEYYQSHQYYGNEERMPRPSYQPNYVPPEQGPSFVSNPYVATPVPQPNGGFMIDTLLQARNPEEMGDELTGVTDIVSYITQEK